MELHELQPFHSRQKKKRIGRGGKKGTYSGRGIKGQKARAGARMKPLIREFFKRYPKIRGYRRRTREQNIVSINLRILEAHFEPNEVVSPKSLLAKQIIRRIKNRVPQIKILGEGKVTKPFVIEGIRCSQRAKEKIEQAGGNIKT